MNPKVISNPSLLSNISETEPSIGLHESFCLNSNTIDQKSVNNITDAQLVKTAVYQFLFKNRGDKQYLIIFEKKTKSYLELGPTKQFKYFEYLFNYPGKYQLQEYFRKIFTNGKLTFRKKRFISLLRVAKSRLRKHISDYPNNKSTSSVISHELLQNISEHIFDSILIYKEDSTEFIEFSPPLHIEIIRG